jgi:hypothetical protein
MDIHLTSAERGGEAAGRDDQKTSEAATAVFEKEDENPELIA